MNKIMRSLEAACGRTKADLVLKNVLIVNVFAQTIHKDDIAIVDDEIVGIGKYKGKSEIDCEGCYAAPGFIDAHVHIESSKVIPEAFARVLIKNGVTACIADPHEIANVMGEMGIKFMIENSRNCPIDIFYMMPSCVPAVDFEDNGAILKGEDIAKFLGFSKVLGLGEVMDVPSVLNSNDGMRKKLALFKNKVIDGHCPAISLEDLNAYIFSGIKTDHECLTLEHAEDELKRGMYVMLREGSAAKNLKGLLPAVADKTYKRFLFCTDDKDIMDLIREGSINHNIKLAIKNGLDPIKAITIATINAAECYGLKKRGAIAPGYRADIVILNSLEDMEICKIIRKGKVYKENNYTVPHMDMKSSMNINHVSESMFEVKAKSQNINVIKMIKNSIFTQKVEREAVINLGLVERINSPDFMKIGVFERHKWTGRYALGFIEGLGISNCSIAQTIGHDSHNIIVVGDKDLDMAVAVNSVIDMGGGIVIVSEGKVTGEIPLKIAGLMTSEDPEIASYELNQLRNTIRKYDKTDSADVFLALSFMTLPVLPEIKITTRGLYDFIQGRFIDLFV